MNAIRPCYTIDIGFNAAPCLPLVPRYLGKSARSCNTPRRGCVDRRRSYGSRRAIRSSAELKTSSVCTRGRLLTTLSVLFRPIHLVPTQASSWPLDSDVFPTKPYLSPHLLQEHCRPALSSSQHCQNHQQSFSCTHNSFHPLRSCFLNHNEAQFGRLRQPGPCCRV